MVPAHPNGFHGIYPATLCPFTRDSEVDEAALVRHVSGLAAVDGIVGVLCNGHAGENFPVDESRDAEGRGARVPGRRRSCDRRLGRQPRREPGGG